MPVKDQTSSSPADPSRLLRTFQSSAARLTVYIILAALIHAVTVGAASVEYLRLHLDKEYRDARAAEVANLKRLEAAKVARDEAKKAAARLKASAAAVAAAGGDKGSAPVAPAAGAAADGTKAADATASAAPAAGAAPGGTDAADGTTAKAKTTGAKGKAKADALGDDLGISFSETSSTVGKGLLGPRPTARVDEPPAKAPSKAPAPDEAAGGTRPK